MRASDDDLLNEYLKVINNKDSEIHRLIAEVNGLELEARKQDDRHKAKVKELTKEVESIQSRAVAEHDRLSSHSTQLSRIRAERDALREDVQTLRSALQTQDARLQALAVENSKIHAQDVAVRDVLESGAVKLKSQDDTIAMLRERCSIVESEIRRAANQLAATEKDGMRWKAEAQRLQSDCEHLEAEIKAGRLREHSEMIPKATMNEQLRHLEARHGTVVTTLEKEVSRIREELQREAATSGRNEASVVNYRRRIQDLEAEVSRTSHIQQEAEITIANERLQQAQVLDEIKQDAFSKVSSLTSQLKLVTSERGKLQNEVTVLQKRLHEAETASSLGAKRFTEELASLEKHLFAARQAAHEQGAEVDAQRNVAEQRNSYIKELQIKLEALRSEYLADSTRSKSELEHLGGTTSRQAAALKHAEATIVDLRNQLTSLQSTLASERAEFAAKEDEWRARCSEVHATCRTKDDEKRILVAKLDDRVRELEGRHQSVVEELNWKYTSDLSSAKQDKEKLQQQVEKLENICQELRGALRMSERQRDQGLKQQEQLIDEQHATADRLTHAQFDVAGKEATIVSLENTLDSTKAALLDAQDQVYLLQQNLEDERHQSSQLNVQCSDLQQALKQNQGESNELAESVRRLEETAQTTQRELTAQLNAMNDRMRSALTELHGKEQQVVKCRLEMQKLQQQHADECSSLQHDVLVPLQEKVEALVETNRKLHAGIGARDAQLEEMDRLRVQLAAQDEALFRLQNDLSARDRKARTQDSEVEDLRQKSDRLRQTTRDFERVQEELREQKLENEMMQRKLRGLENGTLTASHELAELRARDTTQSAALNSKKAELSTIQERLANAESLKAIAEKKTSEAVNRENDLRQQLEDLQATHNTLQLCFQKQQQQLELGRKMREQDIKVREQEVLRQSPQERSLNPPQLDESFKFENF